MQRHEVGFIQAGSAPALTLHQFLGWKTTAPDHLNSNRGKNHILTYSPSNCYKQGVLDLKCSQHHIFWHEREFATVRLKIYLMLSSFLLASRSCCSIHLKNKTTCFIFYLHHGSPHLHTSLERSKSMLIKKGARYVENSLKVPIANT